MTEELCLAVVKQNSGTLKYVKTKQKKYALLLYNGKWICIILCKDQNRRNMSAAVKRNGNSLEFVKDQTEEICLAFTKMDEH